MSSSLLQDIQSWIWGSHIPDVQALEAGKPAQKASELVGAYIIDDDLGICSTIVAILERMEIDAISLPTAERAIEALNRRAPAIIFLDIALQKSDAVEIIRALSQSQYNGVVQLMSGSDRTLLNDVQRIGERHGLTMLTPISKPFRADAIRQAIESANLTNDLAIPIRLEDALAKGWLELWYQPKIDLRAGVLGGVEGLIRCRHPVLGTTLPGKFLPGSSDSALAELTEHVILTALRDWPDFADAGFHIHTAVNTNFSALADLQLAALVRDHRPKNTKWPGLILEITESEAIKDVPLMHEIATQLRIYGISFSIDDFGEGFSSFARLREVPFSELKLDQSFVKGCSTDTKSAGICQAVVDLAHNFGAISVAEGLEFAADLQAIHAMGCDMGQGFLLGRPMPKAEFLAMLQGRKRLVEASPTPTESESASAEATA